jgi:hypothetical protein
LLSNWLEKNISLGGNIRIVETGLFVDPVQEKVYATGYDPVETNADKSKKLVRVFVTIFNEGNIGPMLV